MLVSRSRNTPKLVRSWLPALVVSKPGNTCEPLGASRLSEPRWPPSIQEASSPASISKRSARNCAPTATLTGARRPKFMPRDSVRLAPYSSREIAPAKNDVWLGMPGSSPPLPSTPSGPGAVAVVVDGPSVVLSVFRRLYWKSLCPSDAPNSASQPLASPRIPAVAE